MAAIKRTRALILLGCLLLCGCSSPEVGTIDTIYISETLWGQTFPEYKIDLQNKEVWSYTVPSVEDYKPRDTTAENEGFVFVGNLTDDEVAEFLEDCKEYRFTSWNELYEDDSVSDSVWYRIEIRYQDGSTQTVAAFNKYPKTWNEMMGSISQLISRAEH